MTEKQQHELRCETCEKLWKPACPYYAWINLGNIGISCDSYIEFTSIVGCASHSSPSLPMMNSTELLLIAHDEWKNREERRYLHSEEHWISGWLNGVGLGRDYLQSRIDKIRKGAKERKHE